MRPSLKLMAATHTWEKEDTQQIYEFLLNLLKISLKFEKASKLSCEMSLDDFDWPQQYHFPPFFT